MNGQISFTDALLDPDLPTPDGLVDPKGRPAGKRFNVYRNNVVVSLIEAMETAFPVIHKLVGDEFFKAMAGIYVRANPPANPLLMFYGENFPKFLEEFQPVENLPYLPDVARLELLRRKTYHAADSASMPPEQITLALGDDAMNARFTFSPAMQLIASPYPIHSIWKANMGLNNDPIKPVAETVLCCRPQLDVEMFLLDESSTKFLADLSDGRSLEYALNNTTKDFDFSSFLGLALQAEIITNITHKGE